MTKAHLYDTVIVILLTAVAFSVRMVLLDWIPLGIHGDEAWTGIEARRIVSEGFVPMYSGSAIGQPIGPAWITSLFFRVFGESVVSLRASMSIFGVLTIPIMYFVLRKLFAIKTSAIIVIFFTFSLVHLHFSRLGFMLISAPFFAVGTLYYFLEFIKTKRYLSLILSAFICGLGMYSYNTYPLFPPTIAVALLYLWVRRKITFRHVLTFGIVFVVSSSLLIFQFIDDPSFYVSHHKTASIFNQYGFTHPTDLLSKAQFVAENARLKFKYFLVGGFQDTVDGFGAFQSIDLSILILATGGVLLAFFKKNKIVIWLFFSFLIQLLPLIITIDAYYRREIIGYLYLYIFAGYMLEQAYVYIPKAKTIYLSIIISLVLVSQIALNLYRNFSLTPQYSGTSFVFSPQLYLSIQQFNTRPDNVKMILYSSRYDCSYETFRFLLRSTSCVDFDPENPENTEGVRKPYGTVYLDSYIDAGLESQSGRKSILSVDDATVGVIVWSD